jgi:hypothetical protein
MMLRHATPQRNVESIKRSGLLTSMSRGKLPVVWFHRRSKTAWAVLHTVKRHGASSSRSSSLTPRCPAPGSDARARGFGTAPETCRPIVCAG